MPTLLKTENLSKQYGRRDTAFMALKDVNIEIEKGETVAIVGKSGSGKSTLMHLLSLMDQKSQGTLFLNGEATAAFKPKQRDKLRNQTFGFVFQQFFLNGRDSVLDNVALPLKIAGVARGKRRAQALEILKEVGLETKAKNRANDLSGGQKQRVCVARALINNPEIIFADEPTGNLDSTTGEKITDLLFTLNRERGVTIVIVTHDEDLAAHCQRQIRIKDGEVVTDAEGGAA